MFFICGEMCVNLNVLFNVAKSHLEYLLSFQANDFYW